MSLLFIEKLGQAAALLEKQASARWRSVQGLLKMLGPGAHGKNRLDMLNVAAQKLGQSAKPRAERIQKLTDSLNLKWRPGERLINKMSPGEQSPKFLLRGMSPEYAATPFRGGFSPNWSHGRPEQGLPGVLGLFRNRPQQRYSPNWMLEKLQINPRQAASRDRGDLLNNLTTWEQKLQSARPQAQASGASPDAYRKRLQALMEQNTHETPLRADRNPLLGSLAVRQPMAGQYEFATLNNRNRQRLSNMYNQVDYRLPPRPAAAPTPSLAAAPPPAPAPLPAVPRYGAFAPTTPTKPGGPPGPPGSGPPGPGGPPPFDKFPPPGAPGAPGGPPGLFKT
jgi:hypothetical protein